MSAAEQVKELSAPNLTIPAIGLTTVVAKPLEDSPMEGLLVISYLQNLESHHHQLICECLRMLIPYSKIQRLSFDDHINNFKKTKEVISANIGEAAANKHFNEATYFIGIGNTSHSQKYSIL
ncbi:GDSL esterase/lipase [Glycine max]|nr:GDSL esterase/lipase [Glycine max]